MIKPEFDSIYNSCANNPWEGHAHETYGWWAQQNTEELWWIIDKVSKLQPKKVVEIGSSHGGTLHFWDRMVGPGGLVVSVDLWDAHGITLDFSHSLSEVVLLQADSHDPLTLTEVSDLTQGSIDFLFIDGDHTYEGAKKDYEMFSPLVRRGGIVAFHDVVYDTDIQVRRLFLELNEPKESIEIAHGIGVIYK